MTKNTIPRAAFVLAALLAVISRLPSVGAAPAALRSGPQPGERMLPFTSNMVTGPHRGQQYCYVCQLKDEPAVLAFVRHPDEATARLLREIRDAARERRADHLFGWMVFLGGESTEAQTAMERQAYELARASDATTLPVSVLGDPQGPPGYVIAPEAEVTLVMFRGGKVLYNRSYRAKEWTNRSAESALKELDKVLPPAPAAAAQ